MSKQYIVIGLGSNLGNSLEHLRSALSILKKNLFFDIIQISSIYESDALVPEGSDGSWNNVYLNAAVLCVLRGEIDPKNILASLKEIEIKMGRVTNLKWSPRVIDLDILYWSLPDYTSSVLSIPHKELYNRPFAYLPLCEIYTDSKLEKNPAWLSPWSQSYPLNTKVSSTFFWPKFVGVLNLTENSFSDGGLLQTEASLATQINKFVMQGASVLDLGAESTAPNALPIDLDIEFNRLNWALEIISQMNLGDLKISIDSRNPHVLLKLMEKYKLDYINDVEGLRRPEMIELVKKTGYECFVMHSLSVPVVKDEWLDFQTDPVDLLCKWWTNKLVQLLELGVDTEKLIFDPGIGFGKNRKQNMYILTNLNKFLSIKNNIMIGHSRKSYQTLYSDRHAAQRDLETSLVTFNLNLNYCQYLRVHDIESQKIALRCKANVVQRHS